MKKTTVLLGMGASIVAGCAMQPIAEPLTLPNGQAGFVVNCSGYGLSDCFIAAGEVCKDGYYILERTINNDTKTTIVVEKPTEWRAAVGDGYIERHYKEKYMIISCR